MATLELKRLSAWNDTVWFGTVYLSEKQLWMSQIYYIQATRTHLCLTEPLILYALLLLWVSGIAYVCYFPVIKKIFVGFFFFFFTCSN